MKKTFLASEGSDGSAKRRDQRHTSESLKRSHFLVLKLQLWKKSSDSKGPSDCGPLGGLRRRAVSEAHALEFEFKDFEFKDFDFKKRF
ncbi:hypothetical protein SC206_17665 [Rouxiella sp. T17]|uniref:hypothetical protein n=1 Tax=Rouxiella sp. T17 TaxID=3085684 RepID=UPI002FC79765